MNDEVESLTMEMHAVKHGGDSDAPNFTRLSHHIHLTIESY